MTKTSGNAAVFTLGCRLNQADSALICDRLKSDGWKIVRPEYDGRIDLLIVNTCTVTAAASRKSRQATRRFGSKHPEACILVTGCSAEIENSAWSKEEAVDIILTNPEKKQISSLVKDFLGKKSISSGHAFSMDQPLDIFKEEVGGNFPFKSRAFLKVQEGCNNFCTYCIVPYARGPERSRDWDEVIADFKQFVDNGFEEIVLTGVNICAYNDQGRTLNELIEALCELPGNFRVRLSSTEPHPNNIDLLETMAANPKVCRFLHLSLQHGCDEILKAMGRKYTTAEFAHFIKEARRLVPGIHLGTDVIVGFPGETEEHFEQEIEFVKKMNFSNIHIFTYSKREKTPAATMPDQVSGNVANERRLRLVEIAEKMKIDFVKSQIGKTFAVLFERKNKAGSFQGWSDNYINFICDDPNTPKHVITQVKAIEITTDNSIRGEIVYS
jgi:threonylcarbamoyladenosine tRNA methylthiotransferase MtaB